MVDKIGWMFEESSSLGIVNNDNAAVARFNGSIKTFLRSIRTVRMHFGLGLHLIYQM